MGWPEPTLLPLMLTGLHTSRSAIVITPNKNGQHSVAPLTCWKLFVVCLMFVDVVLLLSYASTIST
jgi:hypothetical protein